MPNSIAECREGSARSRACAACAVRTSWREVWGSNFGSGRQVASALRHTARAAAVELRARSVFTRKKVDVHSG